MKTGWFAMNEDWKSKQLTKSMSKSFFNSWVVFWVHLFCTAVSRIFNDNAFTWPFTHVHKSVCTRRPEHSEQNKKRKITNDQTKKKKKTRTEPRKVQPREREREKDRITEILSSFICRQNHIASTDTCSLNTYSRFVCRIIRFDSIRITSIYIIQQPLCQWHFRAVYFSFVSFPFPFLSHRIDRKPSKTDRCTMLSEIGLLAVGDSTSTTFLRSIKVTELSYCGDFGFVNVRNACQCSIVQCPKISCWNSETVELCRLISNEIAKSMC